MTNQSPNSSTTSQPLIVAVGASAGGLEAFQELLTSIGDVPNLAIVFVQHLDPTSKSLLAELVNSTTSMDVVEISGRRKLKASSVYICPPQTLLNLKNGFVSVAKSSPEERPTAPIDHFFHAVAQDQGDRGIGVILSGAGSDGTLGLKAISDRGGLTFAQDAKSAKYDSMPRSAATTGVADHVMPPAEIAAELLQYCQHLANVVEPESAEQKQADIKEAIPLIAERLMKVTEHNFQHYKLNTLARRIQRRMQVLRLIQVSDYVDFLQHHENEVRSLFRELLIGVTAFFRDPDAFESLKQIVLPKLFESRGSDDCVRIWVAGCSSGQEAYTIAILCHEILDARESACKVQIFATDIDERALQVARAGAYPVGIEEQISPERLKKYFVKRGKQYHVSKSIREMVLFSVHNLISDPPFSRQDLISCRNLLIYLGPHLQNKLIPLFHYALRPSGYLFLGPSENITSHGELFRALDARHRISQRKGTAIGTAVGSNGASQYRPSTLVTQQGEQLEADSGTDLTEIRQRITLDEFSPKSVVIDEDGKILNASADMQKYLTVSGGDYHNNIIKMAARGLRLGLRTAFAEAKKIRRRVDRDGLSIRVGDEIQRVMLTVQPMPRLGEDEALFMVVFHDVGRPLKRDEASESGLDSQSDLDDDAIVAQLERELETTREDLDKTLQDMEAANEELKSSNEELLSMNEELQSANEELETSKEEIQTVLGQIAQSEANQKNLLDSTRIATLFLGNDLRIRSFTSGVTALYNLLPTDVGRPLQHITHTSVEMPPFPDAQTRLDKLPVEDEVETQDGRWYIRRIQPYVTDQKPSDGLVVTFYEITEQKKLRMRLAAAHAVTKLLADADSLEAVIPKVLKALREAMSAEVCLLWRVDERGEYLSCVETDAMDSSRQSFVDESRQIRLAIGEGLPGRVWNAREPVWFSDIQDIGVFLRASSAQKSGLTSGVGMPIVVGQKFKGVIEIFTSRRLTQEPELTQLLESVGNEIGQFIRQRRLDASFRDEEARKTAILQSALDCIVTMDTSGRIVDFNPCAERTFGYLASEVVGKSLADTIIPEEYRDAHRNGLAHFLETGTSDMIGQRIELSAQHANGSSFPIELAISVSRGRDGSHFFTGYLRDITERKQVEATLLKRAELAALHAKLALTLAGEAPLSEILNTCCQRIVDDLDAAFARVWLLNEPEQVLQLAASAGMYTHLDGAHSRVPLGELKIGRIAAARQPLLTNDVSHDPNIGDPEWAAQEGLVAFAGYPLVVEDRVVGVAALFAKHHLASEVFEQLLLMADAMAQCIARKESEQRLLDREQRLNLALDAGCLGTWHWGISVDHVSWSDQLYEIFGYAKDQFQNTRAAFLEIIHPDDRGRVAEQLGKVFTGNCESYEMDFRIIRGDDHRTVWTSGRGVIRRDKFNHPLSITAVASDITERKHWELELADRESHLRSVIDNTLFMIGVLDVDGTLLEANAAAINSAAIERNEVIGKKFWDCYWWNFDQESISRLKDTIRRAANGESVRYDAVVRVADDMRIVIDFMLNPVRSSDGTITHLIPSGVDISERNAAEAAVIEREQFLTLALDAGKMGTFKWEISSGDTEWSEVVYSVYGCSPDQFDGKISTYRQLAHPDDREAVRLWIENEFASDTDDHFVEFRLIRPNDGRTIWVEERGVIHRDASGNALQVTGLVQDISERKAEELNLAFLSDLQTQLVPLTSVDALMEVATKLTTNYLGLSRCLLVEFDAQGETADILCDHHVGVGPSMLGRHSVRDFHDEAERAALIAGKQVLSNDTQARDRDDPLIESFSTFNIGAFCNSAYVTDRGTKFVVSALYAEPHAWQAEERKLLQEVADRVGIRIERARSEEELANREAHLRRVINNQLGLVGVIDRNGILLEVDDRSLKIARTRREDVIGKPFADAPWWSYDPAVATKMRKAMQQAMAGEVVRFDVSLFAHGEEGVMIDFMMAPVLGDEGKVEYLIPSGVDIRERVKIERVQRSVTRRMEMALRAGGMAAWEWTPSKSVWTPELYELLGIDSEQEAGPDLFFSLAHPDDLDGLRQAWQKAIDSSDTYESEFRIIRPDGQIRWLNGLGEVFRNKAGKVVRMYGLNWDSTQDHLQADALRESERRAHAASASKSEFLANMSHEIRTPMTAILGYADLLKDLVNDDEAKLHLQTIRRNGDYLLDIINDILDLSKIEAGKLDVECERFEPVRLVEDVRSIMEVRATESGLTLEVEYDGKLPKVIQSDAKRLKQVLINLIGNAIKFTRKGRVKIRVRFDAAAHQLQFDVIDTGIGISDEQMSRLFKPFSQGDASVTRNFGGTGLGLAISQRLAEILGGSVSASSTAGVGSTFTLNIATGESAKSDLIEYREPNSSIESEKPAGDPKSTKLSCHVLIVDDRRDIRFLSNRILTRAGATVEECEDGLLAIESITACFKNGGCPDLILLDMQMPNLDGYSTAKRLRSLGYSGPIVALTADAMQGDMNKCIEAGCNDYLSKPINAEQLIRLVSELTHVP